MSMKFKIGEEVIYIKNETYQPFSDLIGQSAKIIEKVEGGKYYIEFKMFSRQEDYLEHKCCNISIKDKHKIIEHYAEKYKDSSKFRIKYAHHGFFIVSKEDPKTYFFALFNNAILLVSYNQIKKIKDWNEESI